MKNILFLICFFAMFHIVTCMPKSKPINNEQNALYPLAIKNNKLQHLFDEAKWQLYCLHCDTKLIFFDYMHIPDTPFAGSLDLKFDSWIQRNDTTEIRLKFYYNDTIPCDGGTVKNCGNLNYGVAFKDLNKDSILYFISGTIFTFSRDKNMHLRYNNVLQPDVISFIKSNKDILNTWFYNEAKNRNIINEH